MQPCVPASARARVCVRVRGCVCVHADSLYNVVENFPKLAFNGT